jgi:tellurite resistance protein
MNATVLTARVTKRDSAPSRASRIPLNTLAIPFGLIGWAGCWSTAQAAFGWASWTAEPFWAVAAAALIWLLVAHTIRGHRAGGSVADQLRHPAQGPIAAIVPLSVVMLGAHVHAAAPVLGSVLAYAGIASCIALSGSLVTLWIRGTVPLTAIHGAYFLPTVAAGFITAGVAANIGNPALAVAAFGFAAFFWVVLFTVLLLRLIVAPPLPGPLTPTLAILVAPPAVGGMAWLEMNGRAIDSVGLVLLGLTAFMVVIQIALLPTYRRLRFSLGFWSFTFSACAVANQTIALSRIARYPGWQAVIVIALVAVSVLIVAVAVKSVVMGRSTDHGEEREEQQLTAADLSVESAPATTR